MNIINKKIWLITVGEPLPINEENRLLRTGLLAEILVDRGHKITWWTSTVNHYNKNLFYANDKELVLTNGIKLKFLHGGLYKKNMSLRRILNHIRIAKKFTHASALEDKPDVIVVSYPTIELSLAAVEYGLQYKVPVLVDVRDLWPDIFYEAVPNKLRWLIYPLIRYYEKQLEQVVDGADAIIGITEAYKNWAIEKGSNKDKNGAIFHLSYKTERYSSQRIRYKKSASNDIFRICFFGTFSGRIDLETIYQAASLLKNNNVEFVLCGQINRELQKRINNLIFSKNIKFPGHVGLTQIKDITSKSHMGILPYAAADFTKSIPNKVGEYLSGGLPLLYCLEGSTDTLVKKYECGIFYQPGNIYDLANKIKYVANNATLLNNMRINALKAYDECLNADVVYRGYCDYIEKMSELSK